jgi:hypothetical protein
MPAAKPAPVMVKSVAPTVLPITGVMASTRA